MSTVHTCARCGHPNLDDSPKSMITVRLPRALHELLAKVAHEQHLSLNALCVEQLGKLAEAPLAQELSHA